MAEPGRTPGVRPAAQGQRAGGRRPETVTFENKEIEVTREAADGVWVEGLPGEPPTRIGDLLSSSEDPARSRAGKLRKELNKEAEGITDTGGKVADLIQEVLDNPQPTHSMTHSRGPEMATSGTEHVISAGMARGHAHAVHRRRRGGSPGTARWTR